MHPPKRITTICGCTLGFKIDDAFGYIKQQITDEHPLESRQYVPPNTSMNTMNAGVFVNSGSRRVFIACLGWKIPTECLDEAMQKSWLFVRRSHRLEF